MSRSGTSLYILSELWYNPGRKNHLEEIVRILIDADACPVVPIVEKIAKEREIPLLLLCDNSHLLKSNYAEVVTVDRGADAVDFALISRAAAGDVIVTQDYGVAAMALGKGVFCIHQSGKEYTNENIDQMLFQRHIAKKERRSSSRFRGKGPKKRTAEDDAHFERSFQQLLDRIGV